MPAELLMVVEVKWDDRIQCQAPGCARSVHKRIHVVRDEGSLIVLGSECCERIYGRGILRKTGPKYSSGDGRVLTFAEREMLAANTETFIARIESEAAAIEGTRLAAEEARAAEEQRASADRSRRREQDMLTQQQSTRPWVPGDGGRWSKPISPTSSREALARYRAQQAALAARAAVARVPELAQFSLPQVEQAMIQAKAACLARGLRLGEPGSLNLIEAEALAILCSYRPRT